MVRLTAAAHLNAGALKALQHLRNINTLWALQKAGLLSGAMPVIDRFRPCLKTHEMAWHDTYRLVCGTTLALNDLRGRKEVQRQTGRGQDTGTFQRHAQMMEWNKEENGRLPVMVGEEKKKKSVGETKKEECIMPLLFLWSSVKYHLCKTFMPFSPYGFSLFVCLRTEDEEVFPLLSLPAPVRLSFSAKVRHPF